MVPNGYLSMNSNVVQCNLAVEGIECISNIHWLLEQSHSCQFQKLSCCIYSCLNAKDLATTQLEK